MGSIKLGLMAFLVFVGCSGFILESSMGKSPVSEEKQIAVETTVNAGLADVWRAWTTNEGVQTFFARTTNVDLTIGGPYEMLFDTDAPRGQMGSEGCKVLSYLPMEMLSFSWNAPPEFTHARGHLTWIVVRLEELSGDRVNVKISHLGWDGMKAAHPSHADEWNEVYDYFSKAWPFVLENLKNRFDEGPRWRS